MNNQVKNVLKKIVATEWAIFEKTENKLKEAIFKILKDHAKARGLKVLSGNLELFADRPMIQVQNGRISVDGLSIVEDYD